jgi:hypothetical protein
MKLPVLSSINLMSSGKQIASSGDIGLNSLHENERHGQNDGSGWMATGQHAYSNRQSRNVSKRGKITLVGKWKELAESYV